MRVVCADQLGPPDVYRMEDRPIPEPGPGEVRVRVRAASFGYADALVSAGKYQVTPPLPFVPGTEASGTVDAVGSDVAGHAVGDNVIVGRFGGILADYVLARPADLKPMPTGLTFPEAACFPSNHATALHGLLDRGNLKAGETLLVLGAAGGVGTAALQVGKKLGARVIAGASSPAKRAFAKALGADEVLDYSAEGWREPLRQLTGGKGVDVIFDPVGGDLFEPAFRSLAWGGRHLVIGFAGGPIPRLPANLPLLKGAALVGVDIRQFMEKEPEAAARHLAMLSQWAAEGMHPPVGTTFRFEDYRTAMAEAASGRSIGKVVMEMD